MAERQIKSKRRVADHGEVYTNEREVKAMCDLVKDECERIDSRFLEPACGNGNFLTEILARKLSVVTQRYAKNAPDWEKYSFIAVSSLYGVELLLDNTEECRQRLYEQWDAEYTKVCKSACAKEMRNVIRFILSRNILCGNALTLKQVDENAKDIENKPIIFSEWSIVDSNDQLNRRDFRLDEMIQSNDVTKKTKANKSMPLFADLSDENWLATSQNESMEYDPMTKTWIPKPIAIFKPIYYKLAAQQKEISHD